MSERRACVVIRLNRGTYRYQSHQDPRTELRMRMREIAAVRVRYGCRKILVLLQREGWAVGQSLVRRLYREEGLALRRTAQRKRRVVRNMERRERMKPAGPNQVWSLDFVSDPLADGRRFRALTVVDVYTRESLAIEAGQSLRGEDVVRVLQSLQKDRGGPKRLFCDNGPEFTSRAYLAWALERRIELLHIRPGKPIENAYIESCNGRLREECLNVSWFRNLFDARRQIAAWRKHYNQLRPHSSLGYRTPQEFAALHRAAGLCSAGAGKGGSNADPFPHAPIPAQSDGTNPSCCMLGSTDSGGRSPAHHKTSLVLALDILSSRWERGKQQETVKKVALTG